MARDNTLLIIGILLGILLIGKSGFLGSAIPLGSFGTNTKSIGNITAFGYTFENYISSKGVYCPRAESGHCAMARQEVQPSGAAFFDAKQFLNLQANSGVSGFDESEESQKVFSLMDISNVQELLIIYDGSLTASRNGFAARSSHAQIGVGLASENGAQNIASDELHMDGTGTSIQSIMPRYYKLTNNYDSTFTIYKHLGAGDVFEKISTISITNPVVYFFAIADSGYTDETGTTSAKANLRVLTVITKKNELAICNAAQTPVKDTNGKVVGCIDSASLNLFDEQAIKESYEAEVKRISDRLMLQEEYYNKQIQALKVELANATTQSQIDTITSQLLELKEQQINAPKEAIQVIQTLREEKGLSGTGNYIEKYGLYIIGAILLLLLFTGTRKP